MKKQIFKIRMAVYKMRMALRYRKFGKMVRTLQDTGSVWVKMSLVLAFRGYCADYHIPVSGGAFSDNCRFQCVYLDK